MTYNFGVLCNQRNRNNRTNILFGRNKFRKVQWSDIRPNIHSLNTFFPVNTTSEQVTAEKKIILKGSLKNQCVCVCVCVCMCVKWC